MTKPDFKQNINPEMLRAPVLRDALPALLLFLSGRASVLGMFPFGVAFFAACFDKSIAYIGITALTIALITGGGRYIIVKYLVAALLYWLYTRVKRTDTPVHNAAVCGGSMVLGGFISILYNFSGIYDILLILIEGIIAAMMYIIFSKAQVFMENRKDRTRTAQDELISMSVSAGVFITGLSGIVFPLDISLADVISVYAVLCIALHTSLAAAGSGGLCIGFLTSMSSPAAVVVMGIFGISALFSNLLKSFGKFGVAIGFIGGSAIALLYAGNIFELPVSIIEAAIGSALFAFTPNKVHNLIGTFFARATQLEALSADVRVKKYLKERLEKSADAFKSLEECFEAVSEKRLSAYGKDASQLLDEAADRVCEGCPHAVKCWQKEFTRTYRSIMQLLETIEKKGILTMDNIPAPFREWCIRPELFVMEFNHVYELYKRNLVRVREAAEGRDIVARQYREVSSLMEAMAADITEGFSFREGLEEEIVNELDKLGIAAFEANVIEGGRGRMEVYLSVNKADEKEKIAALLEEVLETPMTYDGASGTYLRFVSRAKYSVDIGIRQANRDFAEVSGDSIDSFTTEDYKHYIIISDGMGSGRRAMNESRATLRLLREFLLSGFGVHTAVDMINSALCLKLDYECFSTIDLLSIDLMTGVCEFFKIGSAESVIMRGANVETVFSVSMPVGMMSNVRVEGQAKLLGDGDTVLMMSDGVSEAGAGSARKDWIKREMMKPFDIMDDMAEAVIETAIKKSRDSILDDMTVAAVRINEN